MKRYYITDKEDDLIVLIFGTKDWSPVAFSKCNLQKDIENVTYNITNNLKELLESKGLTLTEV